MKVHAIKGGGEVEKGMRGCRFVPKQRRGSNEDSQHLGGGAGERGKNS